MFSKYKLNDSETQGLYPPTPPASQMGTGEEGSKGLGPGGPKGYRQLDPKPHPAQSPERARGGGARRGEVHEVLGQALDTLPTPQPRAARPAPRPALCREGRSRCQPC